MASFLSVGEKEPVDNQLGANAEASKASISSGLALASGNGPLLDGPKSKKKWCHQKKVCSSSCDGKKCKMDKRDKTQVGESLIELIRKPSRVQVVAATLLLGGQTPEPPSQGLPMLRFEAASQGPADVDQGEDLEMSSCLLRAMRFYLREEVLALF